MTFGRIDQYLYPYYKADIEAEKLTNEEAIELIEELYVKTSQHPHMQSTAICVSCVYCLAVCPRKAAYLDEKNEVRNDFTKCISCGKCTLKCPEEARKISGEEKSIKELLDEVMLDAPFYRRGNGGVTLSGGEVLTQYRQAAELFRQCKKQSVHTCIETSAFAPWEHLKSVLQYTDLAFLDLKHIDSEKHRELTGVPNEQILDNIRRACAYMTERGRHCIKRRPLIPGMTDDDENTAGSTAFIASLPGKPEINLLPYHNMGEAKYEMAGIGYDGMLKGEKNIAAI